ncbi:hypothetical protein N7454_002309 [Penicillium verhagenii]|nr:hypothetical protein N7454_002309 [Penicillium verhagenii]
MKSFLAFGVFAALCNSAYCFKEGTYKISTLEKKALTEVPGETDLVFRTSNGHPGQIWDFIPDDNKNGYFLVINNLGGYINCESEGSLCTAGEEPTSYLPELVDKNTYELVSNVTGYFLRLAGDDKLKLAGYEPGSDQEFVLTSA